MSEPTLCGVCGEAECRGSCEDCGAALCAGEAHDELCVIRYPSGPPGEDNLDLDLDFD